MSGLRAVEDRPTPKEVYNWRLYVEASILAFGSLLFGYDSAFIGTTIARTSFKADFSITPSTSASVSSNITSAFQAGAFFGAIICFPITERLGRKWALQISVIIFTIGAILMIAATSQVSYIYAGRALTGLGCGIITATVPSYIAELSVPSIRGMLTGLFEISYQVGTVLGFWINYGIDQHMDTSSSASWRVPMAVQVIPAGMVFIGGFLLHESPLWLMRKNQEEKAILGLHTLRGLPADHEYIQEELQTMRDRFADETAVAARFGTGSWAFFRGALSELAKKGMRNRVLLVFCAFALQNFGGAGAINYYSPTLFGSLGITDVSLYTGVYGLVKAISSIIFYLFLIDVWGRRRPTIISSIGCSLCLWLVGAYVKVGNPAAKIAAGQKLSASNIAGGKGATAVIMIYSVFWSFGLNGIPWVVSAEIYPGALRTITGTWAACCNWLTQFIITKSLPYIFASLGYGTWFFFGTWLLIAVAWAFFFLPETKGLTLDQMDIIFGYQGDIREISAHLHSSVDQEQDKDGDSAHAEHC